MKYIYTSENCPKCQTLKEKYLKEKTIFEERSANRIKSPQDDIDQEALIQASMQNNSLPVIVEI